MITKVKKMKKTMLFLMMLPALSNGDAVLRIENAGKAFNDRILEADMVAGINGKNMRVKAISDYTDWLFNARRHVSHDAEAMKRLADEFNIVREMDEFKYTIKSRKYGAVEYNGSHYKYFRKDVTFEEAKLICRSMGGRLAHTTDPAQLNFMVKNLLREYSPGSTGFLGIHSVRFKLSNENYWKSISGESRYLGCSFHAGRINKLARHGFESLMLKGNPIVIKHKGKKRISHIDGVKNGGHVVGFICVWN